MIGDLLLLNQMKKTHMASSDDLPKALLKNGLQNLLRNVRFLENGLKCMENTIFLKEKDFLWNHWEIG